MKNFKKTLIAGAAILSATTTLFAAEKPNVILIMCDDMGYECLNANGVSDHFKTPNLDRIARGGVRFEHAYSQPVCTPSRVQIMTGRYNPRNYIGFSALHPNEITFGNVMRDADYKTCVAGKWQLEGGFEGPHKFGFDEYCLWMLTRRPSRYQNPGLEINGEEKDFPGGYGPDIVNDYVIDFIKRNKNEPFFVYYPMILPHFPYHQTPDAAPYDKKIHGGDRMSYYFQGMVEYADKIVGELEQSLINEGLREETLIIFTCDNGTDKKVKTVYKGETLKGGKGSSTNLGTHVPMIASWPGTIKGDQVSQDLIDFSDILPTLADVGGGQVPTDRAIDGRSFLPLLKGEPGNPRDWVYCWYQRDGKRNGTAKVFARNQTYKLYDDGQMFNVPLDEKELKALTPEQIDSKAKKVRNTLADAIQKIETETQDFSYELFQQKK